MLSKRVNAPAVMNADSHILVKVQVVEEVVDIVVDVVKAGMEVDLHTTDLKVEVILILVQDLVVVVVEEAGVVQAYVMHSNEVNVNVETAVDTVTTVIAHLVVEEGVILQVVEEVLAQLVYVMLSNVESVNVVTVADTVTTQLVHQVLQTEDQEVVDQVFAINFNVVNALVVTHADSLTK
eukprot:gene19257-25112_t